jgi:hypothetical protein
MKKDLRTRIAEGEFTSKLDYGKTSESRKAWREDTQHLTGVFKQAVLEELGIENHPKAPILWKLAWEAGHNSSFYDVLSHAEDFSELLSEVEKP